MYFLMQLYPRPLPEQSGVGNLVVTTLVPLITAVADSATIRVADINHFCSDLFFWFFIFCRACSFYFDINK